jgi:hypothetical protein
MVRVGVILILLGCFVPCLRRGWIDPDKAVIVLIIQTILYEVVGGGGILVLIVGWITSILRKTAR